MSRSNSIHHLRSLATSQSGAALLLLMLVIITGASFILISNLNANVRQYDRQGRTAQTLSDAKAALITYALTYPENVNSDEGPGYLPCPDRTDPVSGNANLIGSAGSSCSLSGETTIGRFPWKTLDTSDLRDHAGERLWYAVSQNFKNNPKVLAYLNSDSPATLNVDTTDDIVAVIIAPGAPVANQDRDISSTASLLDAANYLEGGNETAFEDFYSRATGEFNDQLVFITRQELMQAVEQRVLNRVRGILQDYYNTYGVYPWMAPFADPKADSKWLKGEVTSTSSSLIDSTVNFTNWGVTAGDRVWNLTDGSYGEVTSVAATTLTLTSVGLKMGTNNTFVDGDEYYIEPKSVASKLTGTATTGTSGLTLYDSSRDFDELTVSAGDIVDNITDGSSGMIKSVSNTQITLKSLTGGTVNTFSSGITYRIRSNTGTAGAGSAGQTLSDANIDFTAMNIQEGTIVRNLSLGTSGLVVPATIAQHSLDVTGVSFNTGNYYSISRFNGTSGITKGLLSVHIPGSAFDTGFQVDWSFLATNGNTVTPTTTGSNDEYNTGLENAAQESSGISGTITVASSDADCNWIGDTIVDCRGNFTDTEFLHGTATGVGTSQLTDSNKNFIAAGVKRGDKIENISTSENGILYQSTSSDTVQFVAISPAAVPGFSVGDQYRIYVATKKSSDVIAENPSSSNPGKVIFSAFVSSNITVYNNAESGDVIENISDNSVGEVINKGCYLTFFGFCWLYFLDYSTLQGGAFPDLNNNDLFRVYGNYVDRRHYAFELRFGGNAVSNNNGGTRTRTVCRGYGADCVSTPSATGLFGNGSTALFTINDYKSGGTLLGSVNVTVPSTGTPQSSIRVSGLTYQLADVANELPAWFLKNRWHHLIYVAYADTLSPVGSGNCTAGSDCLEIQGTMNLNDRQALVIAAGMELETAECPDTTLQDRSNGRLCDYFEADNADDSDNLFRRDKPTGSYNDKLVNIAPATF